MIIRKSVPLRFRPARPVRRKKFIRAPFKKIEF